MEIWLGFPEDESGDGSSNISTNLPTFCRCEFGGSSFSPLRFLLLTMEKKNKNLEDTKLHLQPVVQAFNVMALIMRKLFNMRRLVLMSDVARRSMQRNFSHTKCDQNFLPFLITTVSLLSQPMRFDFRLC